MDNVQREFLTLEECDMLEKVGTRMQEELWPEQFTYRTKAGPIMYFNLDDSDTDKSEEE